MQDTDGRLNYSVGVDIGGTKLSAAVVDCDGKVCAKLKAPVQKGRAADSIQQIIEAVGRVVVETGMPWERMAGIGIVIPGVYFAESGRAWAPNLWGWDQVPLRDELQPKLPVQVVIDSDRAAYVLGEQWLGIARGLQDVVFLAVGTGIGAGIITGGRLCRGVGDISGAVGWFALNPQKSDRYKQIGCFEAEAAGPSVGRRAAEGIAAGRPSLLSQCAAGNLDALTAEKVVEAARREDPFAHQLLEETAAWIGMGVANVISLLNPQMVVLGGGLMQAGDLLLPSIRREALEWAQPLAARQAQIELSQLGEDVGLLGAARLVFLRQEVS
jgi:glucokinase